MNITLKSSKIDELSFKKNGETIEQMEFSVSTAFSTEEINSFLIVFELKLQADDEYTLSIRHLSHFEASMEIKEEDRQSPFFSINAPAIAYPFLRAYVANFLLSSGFEAKLLPTINFVKLAQDNDTK